MVFRLGHSARANWNYGRASGTLHRRRGRHEHSSTVVTVQRVEAVDAYGTCAVGICPAERPGNVLRMVCGSFPVVLGHWRNRQQGERDFKCSDYSYDYRVYLHTHKIMSEEIETRVWLAHDQFIFRTTQRRKCCHHNFSKS